jgi:mRNA-degrading endonuclease RelE of RelBE toxin-antitoxin system
MSYKVKLHSFAESQKQDLDFSELKAVDGILEQLTRDPYPPKDPPPRKKELQRDLAGWHSCRHHTGSRDTGDRVVCDIDDSTHLVIVYAVKLHYPAELTGIHTEMNAYQYS